MAPLAIILALFFTSSWGFNEESFALADPPSDYIDDFEPDLFQDVQVQRRNNNNNFMRFGRNDFARPTRCAEKNDHFVRFGRGKEDYLRFGRAPTSAHSSSTYLRFGRADDIKRCKRELYYGREHDDAKRQQLAEHIKRLGTNFLRFGRANSNSMRFGRNNGTPATATTSVLHLFNQLNDAMKRERIGRREGM